MFPFFQKKMVVAHAISNCTGVNENPFSDYKAVVVYIFINAPNKKD
jgi:hypothetical protein